LSAEVLSVRLEVAVASPSSGYGQVEALVQRSVEAGLHDVLDWRFTIRPAADVIFQAIIEDIRSDTSLFPNQRYISFGLRMTWQGFQTEQNFAVLGKNLKDLEIKISQAVRDQLRYDLLPFIKPPSTGWVLEYIHASGLSLLTDPAGFQLGKRYTLTDYHGTDIGLVSVADIIPLASGKSEHAIEFNVVQADRRPEPGMLVVMRKTQWDYTVGPVVSLMDFGLELEAKVPLPSANIFFSVKSGIWMPYSAFNNPNGMDLSLRSGFGARLGFAALLGDSDHWLSDLEIGLTARFGVGMRLKDSGPALFLYGAEAELALRHYISSQWSWGLAAGYRFWNILDTGIITAFQGSHRLFASPFIGFTW
jgi:hypothetical protein